MEIPIIVLPEVEKIETISIPLPTADVPFYTPMVVPPSDLEAEEEIEGEASEETDKPVVQPGIKQIDIPFTDKQVPVPETEILVTATTTAVVSVLVDCVFVGCPFVACVFGVCVFGANAFVVCDVIVCVVTVCSYSACVFVVRA